MSRRERRIGQISKMQSISSSSNPSITWAARSPWPYAPETPAEPAHVNPPSIFDRVDPAPTPEALVSALRPVTPLEEPPYQRKILASLLVSAGVALTLVPCTPALAAQPPAISESVRTSRPGANVGKAAPKTEAPTVDLQALEAGEQFEELAKHVPERMVTIDGFRMTAETAARFKKLHAKIGETFPGREVRITSTTGGRHADPNHRLGKAVDFVVEPLSKKESKVLEQLSEDAGFRPFNEYLHGSQYKTGQHMHVSLD